MDWWSPKTFFIVPKSCQREVDTHLVRQVKSMTGQVREQIKVLIAILYAMHMCGMNHASYGKENCSDARATSAVNSCLPGSSERKETWDVTTSREREDTVPRI